MSALLEVDLPHDPVRIASSGVCMSHRTDRGCCEYGGHLGLLLLSMTRCDERRAGAKSTTTINLSCDEKGL
jgi:hypothetical protein